MRRAALANDPENSELVALQGLVIFLHGDLLGATHVLSTVKTTHSSYSSASRLMLRAQDLLHMKGKGKKAMSEEHWETATEIWTAALMVKLLLSHAYVLSEPLKVGW